MSGINKVFLVGHLGKHPDVRKIAGEIMVASFPLATSETISKNNGKIEITEWHNIVMWRNLAEIAGKLLSKGQLIYLEGKIRTRSFEDKQGIKRYTTEVVAEHFTVLGNQQVPDHISERIEAGIG